MASTAKDDIKSRLDIVAYIQKTVTLTKSGRTYKACCPFHAEKTPSFHVDPDRQTWRCFGACNEGGDIFSFVMKQQGWDFKEALAHLAEEAGVELRPQTPEQKRDAERHEKLIGLLTEAANTYHDYLMTSSNADAQAVRDYARSKRGLTDDTLREFQIGYAPEEWRGMLNHLMNLGYTEADVIDAGLAIDNKEKHSIYDRFRNRLMIPIRDERKRVVGFGGRAMNPNEDAKYINSPQSVVFNKSHLLFGLDKARHAIRESATVVIVEGYMDVIQAQQAGYRNVVAQMGTSLTETQLKLVAPRYASKIIMALDSDAAGQNATRRSLDTARQTLKADYTGRLSVEMRVLHIPGAKDPDDLIRENPQQWVALVEGAMPLADFVIDLETAHLPADASINEREAAARRVLPLLAASENNLYTQDNLQKLALKLRIPERDLLAWARSISHEQAQRPPQASAAPTPDDGPPPRDFDQLEPPTWDDEPPPDPEGTTGRSGGHAPLPVESPESRCLRGLLTNTDSLYEINRRFRELAGDDAALLAGPLADLSAEDFTETGFRHVMTRFLGALDQYEQETIDYLYSHATQDELDLLMHLHLHDVEQVSGRIQQRFSGDLTVMWKQHERRGGAAAADRASSELMGVALELRIRRLKRELDDLSFQQKAAQTAPERDNHAASAMRSQIGLAMRALCLLDAETKRQKSVMTF